MSDDKPNHPIAYRPPKERRAEFDAMWEESGLSKSAFISECIFGRTRHRPAENLKLARLLAQSAEIAGHLRDHRFADTHETRLLQEAILAELVLIRSAIMARLGRRS